MKLVWPISIHTLMTRVSRRMRPTDAAVGKPAALELNVHKGVVLAPSSKGAPKRMLYDAVFGPMATQASHRMPGTSSSGTPDTSVSHTRVSWRLYSLGLLLSLGTSATHQSM